MKNNNLKLVRLPGNRAKRRAGIRYSAMKRKIKKYQRGFAFIILAVIIFGFLILLK